MRLSGWEARLTAVIETERKRDNYPGRCVDFACAAVSALYGFDPMPRWREAFAWDSDQATTRLPLDAALETGAGRFGWRRCSLAELRDGDLAVVHAPRVVGSGLMVVVGTKVLITTVRGLRATSLRYADEFWKV